MFLGSCQVAKVLTGESDIPDVITYMSITTRDGVELNHSSPVRSAFFA